MNRCRLTIDPATDVTAADLAGRFPDGIRPDQALYWVGCDGVLSLRVLTARQVAMLRNGVEIEDLLDRLDVDGGGLQVRPLGQGLVAVPAYFWIDGLDVAALTESLTLPLTGTTVTVTADLVHVDWDFGDGSPPLRAGLGRPWPEHSSVSHSYGNASAADRPFEVTATMWFQPRYTVDGVDGEPLAPFSVTVSTTYAVRELQAVRTR